MAVGPALVMRSSFTHAGGYRISTFRMLLAANQRISVWVLKRFYGQIDIEVRPE